MKKIIAGLILTLAGCVAERPYEAVSEGIQDNTRVQRNYGDYYQFHNNADFSIDIIDAFLGGDMGPVVGVEDFAIVAGMNENDYTTFQVIVDNGDEAIMTLITIDGGVNHPGMEVGNHLEFGGSSYALAEEQKESNEGLHVRANVCSGVNGVGNWDYDDIANKIEIDVESTEYEGVKRISFTTYTEGDVASGYIDVYSGD